MTGLRQQHCRPYAPGEPPLTRDEAGGRLSELHPDWHLDEPGREIGRAFHFKGFRQTIAFVNALAWIADRENHHPELRVGYNHCQVRFHTHSVGGLTENDLICAAKIDALVEPLPEPE